VTRISVLGLGEAGGIIARDLAAAGASVVGFDPVAPPVAGIERVASAAEAVRAADVVLSLNASAVAVAVLSGCITDVPASAVYADLNSTAPELKREMATLCQEHGLLFADVALMTPVPGKGLQTPMYASGTGASRYAEALIGLGAEVEVVGQTAGDAATRKLLRSIYAKGLAAVVIDAIEAAARVGQGDWMRENIENDLEGATRATVERLISGTAAHVVRRTSEVKAARELAQSAGYESPTSEATLKLFGEIIDGRIRIIEATKEAAS
jgi:3-hydroxyisobutyrate dehydrogenase-like beta-hydroxyacid dehydrogenase